MLFPIIPDSMLSGRTEKYSSSSPRNTFVWENTEIQQCGCLQRLAERYFEIPISINYVLCRLLLRDASDSRINPLSWLRLIFPHRGKNKAPQREEIIIGDFLPRGSSQIDFPLNNIQFSSTPPISSQSNPNSPCLRCLYFSRITVCISSESPFPFLLRDLLCSSNRHPCVCAPPKERHAGGTTLVVSHFDAIAL